jgi:hypothetical protein
MAALGDDGLLDTECGAEGQGESLPSTIPSPPRCPAEQAPRPDRDEYDVTTLDPRCSLPGEALL